MGYLKKMMRSQGMQGKKKAKDDNGEKQCPDCGTFKKADNCIRCFRLERAQHLQLQKRQAQLIRLIEDLRQIVDTTSYLRLQDKIKERLRTEQ